jgi:UDP-2,4-diacetamido-2,4,6-trideoxy-beta-L-altropyranose hydrolase
MTALAGKLLIRADADTRIGTGHVMRCLALAQAWQAHDGVVELVTSVRLPISLKSRLLAEGIAIHRIDQPLGSVDDANQVVVFAQASNTDVVIVDGYHFGAEYQQTLKAAGLRILFIDDNGHADHYYADWVLNQNIYAREDLYANREPYTRLLLGTHYALLRREFWKWREWQREIPEAARKVLIMMGGSDPDNVTLQTIRALRDIEIEGLEIVAVVGGGNPHYGALVDAVQQSSHQIRLERNVTDMPALMAWADVAISAAGSTVWELVFMGLPALLVVLAENQRRIAETVCSMALAQEVSTADIASPFMQLVSSAESLREQSRLQQALIDGNGAERIVTICFSRDLDTTIRQATPVDAGVLWQWANDPSVRANSFNSREITWPEHVAWYFNKLLSDNTRIWVFENGHIPVAQIRYDRLNETSARISYMVDAAYRGRGFGTHILQATALLACGELKISTLEGETFAHNTASVKAFEKAGFKLDAQKVVGGQAVYVFRLQGNDINDENIAD